MKTYLCMIIDRRSRDEIKTYEVEQDGEVFSGEVRAKMKARDLFVNDQKYQKKLRVYDNWCIECCEL